MAASAVYVEEELGRKWDRCFSDTLLKFGGGIVLGSVFSLLFFKRKRWPIIMGGGFGVGMAYSNCERDLNATIRDRNMKSKTLEKKLTKIYFRILPSESIIWDYIKILDDHKTVYIRCLQELAKSKELNATPTFWTFESDYVFFNESQKEIYNNVMSDVILNLSQGLDAVIMAYGQTGCGKSLTISGVHNSYHERGILPRIVSDLFQMKKDITTKNGMQIGFQLSFIEISKSVVHDLLRSYPNNVNGLKDITKIKLKNEDEALKYIFLGEGRREYSENLFYSSHSYSSICTFYINLKKIKVQDQQIRQCKLHIIDLAGTDTIGNFSCEFKNARDVASANLTKTQLEQFFLVLSTNIPEHIKTKYRLNLIIQYLGNSLCTSSVLRFIGHIRTCRKDLLITISMLRFGVLIGGLKTSKYEVNIDKKLVNLDTIHDIQDELNKIKSEKHKEEFNSILTDQDLLHSFNADRFAHVQRTVNEYLQDKISKLTLLSVCEINVALEILKLICRKYEEEKSRSVPSSQTKIKRASASSNRLNKTSSVNLTGEKLRASSAPLKASKYKTPSVCESMSQTRSKTSSSSLVRHSLSLKKTPHSSVSREVVKSKTDPIHSVPVEVLPEYIEAWDLYKIEKKEFYENYAKSYGQNEAKAKGAYKMYINEMEEFKEIVMKTNKLKNDLLLAKMTRQLQNIENYSAVSSDIEKCCTEQLRKLEKEQTEKRETILTSQSMFKVALNICNKIKREIKDDFDQYCREKYHMPFIENSFDETFTLAGIEETVEEEHEVEELSEYSKIKRYKQLKHLMMNEQRKKRIYQLKHKEWTFF